jgi:hypothetical protein
VAIRETVTEGLPSVSGAETQCRRVVSCCDTMPDNTEGLVTLGNTEARLTLL